MNRVAGKVAFITGIARGQGRAHAVRLAEEGADIIGIDVCADLPYVDYPLATEDDLLETVQLVEALGRRIVVGKADVREPASMRAVLDEGVDRLGRLDFVLANAGVMPTWGRFAQHREAWQVCLDVMLTGVLNTVELTYPILRDRGEGGSIVITGSMAATKPMMRTEGSHTLGLLGYAAAKSALVNLAQNYASFLAYHHIRVNVVHPTGVDTPMINNSMMDEHSDIANPEDRLVLVNAIPVNRVEPIDVANTVLWLCSAESRYFTGNAVRIDAGAFLR
ncbi:mycofactocin-coupled SDR family oxidoreductase [Pseudonocardia sp. CA-107938]|uniref:mycofactocin-coupled SDR family oxidoreductase n=1 Tax=Pseudonocardia sp. CA-107938 TaxID=3240021 RepID=UPI003D90405D